MLHSKMTKTDYIVEAVLILIGAVLSIIVLYPILNIIAKSFSSTQALMRGDVSLIPKEFTTGAYKIILTNEKILRATWNSIKLVFLDLVFRIAFTYLTAYPLAYCDFPGKKIWTKFILLAMWLSAGTIPYFLCLKGYGLYNSYWALVLGGMISPFHVVIVRNYMEGISKELIDASRIDGANEFKILRRVVLPLSKPILATLAIWYITATWNSYMAPTIYLADSDKFVLQQVLRSIVLENNLAAYDMTQIATDVNNFSEQIQHAVLIVSMVPMVIMYPFAQKHFTKGVMLGGVKG